MTGWNWIAGRWVMNKDPASIRNYGIDWTAWLADLPTPGDTVASAIWTISDESATPLMQVASNLQGNIALVKLSGGTLNTLPSACSARCMIDTTLGQEVQPLTLYFNVVTQ